MDKDILLNLAFTLDWYYDVRPRRGRMTDTEALRVATSELALAVEKLLQSEGVTKRIGVGWFDETMLLTSGSKEDD